MFKMAHLDGQGSLSDAAVTEDADLVVDGVVGRHEKLLKRLYMSRGQKKRREKKSEKAPEAHGSPWQRHMHSAHGIGGQRRGLKRVRVLEQVFLGIPKKQESQERAGHPQPPRSSTS